MRWIRGVALAIVASWVAAFAFGGSAVSAKDEVDAFNKRYVELHLKMDTAGIFGTWAEDGVSLMPGEAPLLGKKAIVKWVENILSQMPGYKVVKEEIDFHDLQISGIGPRNGLRNIRLCSRRVGNRRSIRAGRWPWCCTARRMGSGK
jgi:hypothetical protein